MLNLRSELRVASLELRGVCSKTAHAVGFRQRLKASFVVLPFLGGHGYCRAENFFGRAGVRPTKGTGIFP